MQKRSSKVALHFMHYNFVRPHMTLKTTPAVEAGVSGHVWTLEEVIALTDDPTMAIDDGRQNSN
jgi:hypothetical protein